MIKGGYFLVILRKQIKGMHRFHILTRNATGFWNTKHILMAQLWSCIWCLYMNKMHLQVKGFKQEKETFGDVCSSV